MNMTMKALSAVLALAVLAMSLPNPAEAWAGEGVDCYQSREEA